MAFEVEDSSLPLLQRGQQSFQPQLGNRILFTQRDTFAPRSIEALEHVGRRGFGPMVFLLRAVLWSLDDGKIVELLQNFIPLMRHPGGPFLVISDFVSPRWGTFEPHVERAFRRRDVALLTMHNVKQRTAAEWEALIRNAIPDFKVRSA
ncbi:MAG: hypothetical protein Q9219_007056 [cf. Caloplaca sp. 3 TL-2023]